jgi:hypothetical protein
VFRRFFQKKSDCSKGKKIKSTTQIPTQQELESVKASGRITRLSTRNQRLPGLAALTTSTTCHSNEDFANADVEKAAIENSKITKVEDHESIPPGYVAAPPAGGMKAKTAVPEVGTPPPSGPVGGSTPSVNDHKLKSSTVTRTSFSQVRELWVRKASEKIFGNLPLMQCTQKLGPKQVKNPQKW